MSILLSLLNILNPYFFAEGDTILTKIGAVVTSVLNWIVNLFTTVSGLFWDSTANEFTFVGVLLLVAFGLSMVWVVINFIKKLVKRG